MKTRVAIVCLIVVLSLAVAVPAMAAYYISISVTESSGTDYDMLAMQSELRFPIAGRITGAAFAEVAQVTPRLEEVDGDAYKTSFGLGLRYQLRPKQRLTMRADIGWVDGMPGIVAYFREAF